MFFNDESLDQLMEIAECTAHLPDPNTMTKSLFDAKADAIRKTLEATRFYRKQVIRNDLVHVIFTKKMKMIDEATTVAVLRQITEPPKPHYTGNGFTPSPNSVPEEEMIAWSFTSLRGPLIEPAYRRYLELFRMVFGVNPETAHGEELNAIALEVEE